jgi:cytoskeletal protein CcmA (bactofilin family)
MSQSSVIGAGTVVRGNVEGDGSLEIFGRVEGDVSMGGDVVVGETGAVRGNVSGEKISVQGAVQGDLRGADAVLLERGAKVVGDLSAPRIGIANGALVRGTVRTEGEPALAANKRAAAAVLKPAVFAPKPVAKTEPKYAPPPRLDDAGDEDDDDDDDEPQAVMLPPARPREKEAERRPPPPVLPSLGKGAKAKKKKYRE